MTYFPLVGGACEPSRVLFHSPLALLQLVGEILIPVVAVVVIGRFSRRYPTRTVRWANRRLTALLSHSAVLHAALAMLAAGALVYGVGIVITAAGGVQCYQSVAAVAAVGLLLTLVGAMTAAAAEAVAGQLGWVLLAAFFALDVWIVFGMVMMHLQSDPRAPDPMLLLAFIVHAVCMFLTMLWAFHARNLSTMAQVRADEAGRSIGAVWVFLAAYIVVGFFEQEKSPFDTTAGSAVLSALTLSALALTMGSGYTKYREVMAEGNPTAAPDPGLQ